MVWCFKRRHLCSLGIYLRGRFANEMGDLEDSTHDEDSTTLHYLVDSDGLELMDGSAVFFQAGQAVQLEDGSTAFLQAAGDEGTESVHPVQLENGTMAYIALSGTSLDPLTLDQNLAMVETTEGNVLQIAQYQEGDGGDSENPDDEMSYSLDLVEVDDDKTHLTVLEQEQDLDDSHITITKVDKSTSTSKSYECPMPGCSKKYTALHHLKVHARAHTGDRPFSCTEPTCDKKFGTNYALKAHIRTHTGEKPYHCLEESCGKSFKTSGDLQKHIRTHTGERPFKCNVPGCNRAFTTSNIRKVHVRTHTGERPYECTEPGCGRAFASATNFKNHMRIHSGEKPYVCTVKMCGRRFTEYSSLYKHQTVHTQQKPYECRECGRHYRQSSTLTMHRRTAHGIIQALDGSEIVLSLPPNAGKIENFMFLELTKDGSALVPLNTNRGGTESLSTQATITVTEEDSEVDEDDEGREEQEEGEEEEDHEISVISREMVDEDGNSMGQILVVTDENDVSSLENFDSLDNVDL